MDDVVYVMGRTPRETARLQAQSALYNPSTRWLFHQAGLEPGMRVLDVGSGAGDVALLAADIVGPRGSVVGVDINGDILKVTRERAAGDGLDNCTFVEGDIRTIDLPADFDAAVGRLVLMYLPDPTATLADVARVVRPRGIVAFQEMDRTLPSVTHPNAPWVVRVQEAIQSIFSDGNVKMSMGLSLRTAFVDAGLGEPAMFMYAPAGGGRGWPGYDYLAATLASVWDHLSEAERLAAVGATTFSREAVVEAMEAEGERTGGSVMLRCWVGAWTRTPGR